MTRLRRRVRHAAGAVRETALALAVAVAVETGLRVTTLPRLCGLLGVRLGIEPGRAGAADGAAGESPHGTRIPAADPSGAVAILPVGARARVAACNRVMGVWPFGDTCLRRCLLLGQRLRRLDPVLRIGVHADGPAGRPGAHSWLEIGGLPLEAGVERFALLGGTP